MPHTTQAKSDGDKIKNLGRVGGMKTEKPLLQSKTFWGGLIAVIPFVSEVLQDVAGLAIIPAPIGPIIAAAGGVLAILGRVVASKKIGGLIK